MQNFKGFLIGTAACCSLGLAVAMAAGPSVDVQATVGPQNVQVEAAPVSNPSVVAVSANGPLLNGTVRLQGISDECLTLIEQIYPGVCVPVGPGLPVSPN